MRPLLLLFCSIGVLGGCSGKTLLTPVEGEPSCPAFEVGAARLAMKGALEHPVQITVRDGKTQIARVLVTGMAEPSPRAKVGLPDANAEYTVEWGVCPNARATEPAVDDGIRKDPHAVVYQCGDAAIYKTEKLTTKKGDPESHRLTYPPSAEAKCLESRLPPKPPPPPPPPPRETPPPASAPAEEPSALPSGGAPSASASAK